MKKKNELIVWSAAIALLTLAASCKKADGRADARSVELTSPEPLSPTAARSVMGVVREAHTINLGFKTAGQITHIYAKEGDRIRKGQLLAELDADDYRLNVEALQLQYDQTKREVERLGQLYRQKSVSANDYEKAESGLKQLAIQLQSGKNQLAYTRLYAPCDARVQSVNLSAAEMAGAGTPVFMLLDVSQMEVVADIPASDYLNGMDITAYHCQIAGFDSTFAMRFLSLAPKADNSQLYQLRLTFADKADKRLTAGMNATVVMSGAARNADDGLALPLCAVFEDSDGNPSVWVMNPDSTLAKRNITIATTVVDGNAVVTGGLRGDERIVRAGAATLQEGEKVKPIEEPKATNIGALL